MPEESTAVIWNAIPRASWGTPSSLQYKELRQVGKGTYGDVYLGQNLLTKETVALKKVSWKHADEKHKSRGFPMNALREIRLLKNKCSHPNVVKLLDVAAYVPPVVGDAHDAKGKGRKKNDSSLWEDDDSSSGDGFVYLVFEYVDHDLAGLLDIWREKNVPIGVPVVKCLLKQLLEALVYLHAQDICHRDLKSSNLLISRDYHLKLADFGLARELNTDGVLTTKVVTLWYRAPELLLGDTRYTSAVDVWSVGCIFVELMKNTPLFPGKDEMDQLKRIFSVCGWPGVTDWPDHANLPLAKNLAKLDRDPKSAIAAGMSVAMNVEEYCAKKGIEMDGGYLAARMLALDPARRYSAHQALSSKFVADAPPPSKLPPMEIGASFHEWETRKAKKNAAAAAAAKASQPRDGAPPPSTTASKSQVGESLPSGVSQEEPARGPSRDASKSAAEEDERSRKGVEGDDRKSRGDRKQRGSSPSRGRGRGRSASVDSRDRRRRRSRSPRRRDKKRDSDQKSGSTSKRGSRRSRSPSRRKQKQ